MEQDIAQRLKLKIDSLIALYEAQVLENERLRTRLESTARQLEEKTQKVNTLEKQLNNLQLTSAIVGDAAGSNAAAKRKVEKLMREIDRCIGLLGNS